MLRLIRGTLWVVLIGGGLLTLGARVPVATDAGLVGLWQFDEGEGTSTSDSSGNGNDGTLSGAALPAWSSDAAPIPNNPYSLAFDGTNNGSYVEVAPAASLDLTETLTMAAWVKPAVPSGGDSPTQGIISKPQQGGYRLGAAIRAERIHSVDWPGQGELRPEQRHRQLLGALGAGPSRRGLDPHRRDV